MEERINNYENQIENLMRERKNLLEELQNKTASPVPSSETGKQGDDKLAKINTKLKRALQIFKDKLHRIATERPNLFINVGEETNERLDHLIVIIENQVAQIEALQNEYNDLKVQHERDIDALKK